MGCIFGKHSKNDPQPSNGGKRKKPPHEIGFSLLGTSEIKLLLAARRSDFHGYAVADVPTVLQIDREMEIPEATKGIGLCGELNKFVPAYGSGFTNLGTSILCQGENYDCDVVCFTADVDQGVGELEGLEANAKASGASQLVEECLKEEFVPDFIRPFGLPMRV